jgi:Rrf2 family protein
MITREADYSIRAILYLSQPGRAENVVPVKELAESTDIPYRFLRKIMLALVNSGFVISIRGRNGGFRLARKPQNISMLDVLQATDPRGVTLNRCLREGEVCLQAGTCPVHVQLRALQDRVDSCLGSITFDELHRSNGESKSCCQASAAS